MIDPRFLGYESAFDALRSADEAATVHRQQLEAQDQEALRARQQAQSAEAAQLNHNRQVAFESLHSLAQWAAQKFTEEAVEPTFVIPREVVSAVHPRWHIAGVELGRMILRQHVPQHNLWELVRYTAERESVKEVEEELPAHPDAPLATNWQDPVLIKYLDSTVLCTDKEGQLKIAKHQWTEQDDRPVRTSHYKTLLETNKMPEDFPFTDVEELKRLVVCNVHAAVRHDHIWRVD